MCLPALRCIIGLYAIIWLENSQGRVGDIV
jgi:hypothetical protein